MSCAARANSSTIPKMRRILRWVLILLGTTVVAAVVLIAYVFFTSGRLMARTYGLDAPRVAIPSDAASVARGKYVYEKIALCADCHDQDLGGKVVEDNFVIIVSSAGCRGCHGVDLTGRAAAGRRLAHRTLHRWASATGPNRTSSSLSAPSAGPTVL